MQAYDTMNTGRCAKRSWLGHVGGLFFCTGIGVVRKC